MFVPVIPAAHNVVNKTIIYQDTVLPLKDFGKNLIVTKIKDVFEHNFEDILNIILKSNEDVLFNTIQYSKKDKILYFYTNKNLNLNEYNEKEKNKYNRNYNIKNEEELYLEDYLCRGKINDNDISLNEFYSYILDKVKNYNKERYILGQKVEDRIFKLAPDEKLKRGETNIGIEKIDNRDIITISLTYSSFSDIYHPVLYIDCENFNLVKTKEKHFCVNEDKWLYGCKDILVEIKNFFDLQEKYLKEKETLVSSHYFYKNSFFDNLSFNLVISYFLTTSVKISIKHYDKEGNVSEIEKGTYIERNYDGISYKNIPIDISSLNYNFYNFCESHKSIFDETYLSAENYADMLGISKEQFLEDYNGFIAKNAKKKGFLNFFKKNKK